MVKPENKMYLCTFGDELELLDMERVEEITEEEIKRVADKHRHEYCEICDLDKPIGTGTIYSQEAKIESVPMNLDPIPTLEDFDSLMAMKIIMEKLNEIIIFINKLPQKP